MSEYNYGTRSMLKRKGTSIMDHYNDNDDLYGRPGYEQQYFDQPHYGPDAPKRPTHDHYTDQPHYGLDAPKRPTHDLYTDQPHYGLDAPKRPTHDLYTDQPHYGPDAPKRPTHDHYTDQPHYGLDAPKQPTHDHYTDQPHYGLDAPKRPTHDHYTDQPHYGLDAPKRPTHDHYTDQPHYGLDAPKRPTHDHYTDQPHYGLDAPKQPTHNHYTDQPHYGLDAPKRRKHDHYIDQPHDGLDAPKRRKHDHYIDQPHYGPDAPKQRKHDHYIDQPHYGPDAPKQRKHDHYIDQPHDGLDAPKQRKHDHYIDQPHYGPDAPKRRKHDHYIDQPHDGPDAPKRRKHDHYIDQPSYGRGGPKQPEHDHYIDQPHYGTNAPKQSGNEHYIDQPHHGRSAPKQHKHDHCIDRLSHGRGAPRQPNHTKQSESVWSYSSGGHVNQAFMDRQQPVRHNIPSAYVQGDVNRSPAPGPVYSPSLCRVHSVAPDCQELGMQNAHREVQEVECAVAIEPHYLSQGWLQNDRKDLSQTNQTVDSEKQMCVDSGVTRQSTLADIVNKPDSNTAARDVIELNSSDTDETEERKQQSGKYITEAWVGESEKSTSSSMKSADRKREKSNVCVLPEIPAERELNRITSMLHDVHERTNQFLCGKDLSRLSQKDRKQFNRLRKERKQLQKKRKTEVHTLHIRNVQLSFQMQQQSLGAYPCDLTHADQKLKRVEQLCENKFEEHVRATVSLADLESKIDSLVSVPESEGRDLTEYESKILRESLTRKFFLQNRLKQSHKDHKRLLNQAAVKRYGIDPFSILVKLGKKIKAWRMFRQSNINFAQGELLEKSVSQSVEDVILEVKRMHGIEGIDMSKTGQPETPIEKPLNAEENDVIVISDSDQRNDDKVDLSVMDDKQSFKSKKAFKRWKRQQAEKKRFNEQIKITSVIDKCVRKTNLTADVDKSHFLLSGLASVLARNQQSKLRQLHHQAQHQETTKGHVAAHCQLIGQIANKLKVAGKKFAGKNETGNLKLTCV